MLKVLEELGVHNLEDIEGIQERALPLVSCSKTSGSEEIYFTFQNHKNVFCFRHNVTFIKKKSVTDRLECFCSLFRPESCVGHSFQHINPETQPDEVLTSGEYMTELHNQLGLLGLCTENYC